MKAVAEYIHSMLALSPRQGMPPPRRTTPDRPQHPRRATPPAGANTSRRSARHVPFRHRRSAGHRDARHRCQALQNLWVSGGAAGGRGGRGGRGAAAPAPGAPNPRAVIATVTLPAGEKVEGRLLRLDDFFVALARADGTIRSFTRRGARAEGRLQRSRSSRTASCSTIYTDKDMHDVTAYLATLK